MIEKQLKELLNELVRQPQETEWVEFKLNYQSPEEIGEYISALSNGASLHNQVSAYLIFGVEDKTHLIKGTTFHAKSTKKGNEELESLLINRLNPKIDFVIYEFDTEENKHISMFVIPATKNQPVEFINQSYIRIGSTKRKLNEFPQKQAKIWNQNTLSFEKEIAKENLEASEKNKSLLPTCLFKICLE